VKKKPGESGMRSKPSIEENVVYSREEAAQALGVSLSTLKRLISTGQLAASQPAGMRRVFIKGSSILAMLDTTRVENGHYAS
jgi:excisionase family DNA binding protein